MAIAAAIVLPLGLLFLISGLLVNLIQAVVFILVRPFSKRLHRRINKEIVELLWLQVIWLFDWWANMKIELYADAETLELLGKEHALVISNHRSDIDWLVGWVMAQRVGCLGTGLALIKKEARYLPVLGWSMWFSDYIFLERNWAKDQDRLKTGLDGLNGFPLPFWLALFVEGTRFTPEKLLAAQEYAQSAVLPIPRNVLIPRTKGFVTTITHLRSFVPAIYNMTLAIPKDEPRPTLLRLLRGRSSTVHLHLQRHLMNELPETETGIAKWCKDAFVEKDDLLERHRTKDSFGISESHDIGRPKRSLMVVLSWSFILLFGVIKFFEWCPFTKGEVAFCIAFLVIVMFLMQILVVFSQSEQSNPSATSTPATSAPNTLNEKLLPR
ncbi:acyltransferase [Lithospermum erythrorhizon]|uniref:1-acylglycerol-3-phosphate O-acyltransferase n=1 Tax=Lithospermum erythrorhizon TaxID=34254 RepID=A0AAV3NX47_LITER